MKRNVPQGAIAAIVAAVTTIAVMIVGQPSYVPASQGPAFLDTTGTYSGLQAANRINGAIDALLTCNKGSTAPTNALSGAAEAGQCWIDDTSATMLVKKRYTGSSWVVEGVLDVANGVWSPPVGGGTAAVNSATSTDLCSAPAAVLTINGGATIAGFGSNCVIGTRKVLVFQTTATLTYNATQLIIPGQRDYLTSAGDVIEAVALGSGNWRVTSISKIDGNAILSPSFRVGTLYTTFEDIDAKAVLAYGQALSRASFPDYLAAVTRTQTATRSSGNATLTGVSNTRGLGAGMPVEGAGIGAGCTIASLVANTSITLNSSSCVTSSGTSNVTVFKTGYGSGGDSTTVGVPNCEGKKIAGRSNMSGTDSGTLTGATALNSTLGNSTRTLLAANLPPVTPTGTASTGTSSSLFWGVNGVPVAVGNLAAPQLSFGSTGTPQVHNYLINDGAPGGGGTIATTTATVSSSSSTTITMDPLPGAASAAFGIVDPTLIADCAMRVLP